MYTTLFSVALFASVAVSGALADFKFNAPSQLVQCQETQLTWTDGTGPFNLIVVPSADPCSETLADLGDHTSWSMKWTPTLAAGTKVLFSLEDSTGAEAWSGELTVAAGSTSCLSGGASSVSASGSGSQTAAAGSTVTATPSGPIKAVESGAPTSASASASSAVVGPVGAAGAGIGSDSGASSIRAPAVLFGAFGAVLAFAL